MPSPKWQFFMHSTDEEDTIFDILKSGKIYSNGYENSIELENSENDCLYCRKATYCQYIFDGIPYDNKLEWRYESYNYSIVLDPQIAKDLKMYVCNSVQHGGCIKDEEARILHTNGELQRMPPLQKLRTHILNFIELVKNNKRYKRYGGMSYFLSHEVLFPDIPIKYIRAILIPHGIPKKK